MIWQQEELESIYCDLCGGSNTTPVITRPDGMNVVRCVDCSLVFLNPRPMAQFIGRLYEQDYFVKATGSDCGYADYVGEDNRLGMQRQCQQRIQAITEVTGPLPRTCLEVGCATGEFCNALAGQGVTPTGTDLSEYAIGEARSRYPGIDFRRGGIESLPRDRKFDAIFAFELIEHVLSPTEFFQSASELIAPGGLLVFTTPNVECARRIGESRWLGYLSSFEHLYFLSPDTLNRYCRKTGFDPVQWMTAGSGLPIERQVTRDVTRSLLRKTGLLRLARAARDVLRRSVGPVGHGYRTGGDGHNLLFICRKAG